MNVLLIGGNRGIGKAIADKLREDSHNVYCLYRSGVPSLDLRASEREIRNTVRCGLQNLCGRTGEQLDVLIVSSGMGAYYSPLVSDEKIKTLFQVNLFGPMLVYRTCLKHLLKSKGKAIFLGSVVARRPGSGGLSMYSAVKGALNSWVISEGRRAAKKGVSLTVVSPGMVNSEMTQDMVPVLKNATTKNIPFGRWAECNEVADFTVSLLNQSNWTLAGGIFEISGGA